MNDRHQQPLNAIPPRSLYERAKHSLEASLPDWLWRPLVRAWRFVRHRTILGRLFWCWYVPYSLLVTAWHLWWLKRHGKGRIPRQAPLLVESPLVVMLASSFLPRDPRIEREARALAAHGFRVRVICPYWTPDAPVPDWGPNVSFKILPAGCSTAYLCFPYLFQPKLYHAALEEGGVWAYHAHDLDTALPALLAAAQKRVPCVCDFHEWYSQNVSYDPGRRRYRPHPAFKRVPYEALERLALHSASAVVTVCDSIARLLEERYQAPRPVHVIRNIPVLRRDHEPTADVRSELGLPPETKVVLYQGGVGPSRNLEPVIHAMAHVERAVFVIRGPFIEHHREAYLKLAEECGAAGKVFCVGPVPSAEVVAQARSADCGVWTLLSGVGLNFELALPNKVFEYMAAGLPLLAADLPEVRCLVARYGCGLCFDPESPTDIARAINRMLGDDLFRQRCRDKAQIALDDLQADREWLRLVQLYRSLMTNDSGTQQKMTLARSA